MFKHTFLVFKQHYIYFHTLIHPHVFPKNINNVIKTTLPNRQNKKPNKILSGIENEGNVDAFKL